MAQSILFHEGSRALQDAFESRRIADRLEQVTMRTAFAPSDTAFIERAILFFLATADAEGRPDLNHKGGPPGFVRVTGPSELAFPDYDGNGMFKNLGNITVNPSVSLLFIDFERPRRLRVNGTATVSRDDPLLATTVGAQLIVRVTARAIFPNCPRYIPTMKLIEPSIYTPKPGETPVEPAWKSSPEFADAVHTRAKTATGK
jgi:predicted pyridoxine 5'-phosphate oxidase superfamily flavin-nucleotide-binding protein